MSRGPYFTVPAGTIPRPCRGCQKPTYWIRTPKGLNAPIDCQADPDCRLPTATEPGLGLSHFATCPKAYQFRRSAPTPSQEPRHESTGEEQPREPRGPDGETGGGAGAHGGVGAPGAAAAGRTGEATVGGSADGATTVAAGFRAQLRRSRLLDELNPQRPGGKPIILTPTEAEVADVVQAIDSMLQTIDGLEQSALGAARALAAHDERLARLEAAVLELQDRRTL